MSKKSHTRLRFDGGDSNRRKNGEKKMMMNKTQDQKIEVEVEEEEEEVERKWTKEKKWQVANNERLTIVEPVKLAQ